MATDATTGKLTYSDYAAIPNDGKRHEIIDGVHYVNAAPHLYHQAVSKRLQYELYTKIELTGLGILYNAPCDVEMSDHDIVQPDLLVVLNASKHILTPTRVKGVPDLLVEILSPSNPDHDRVRKRGLYERAGVPEYWIVDPTDHEVTQLVLKDSRYEANVVANKLHAVFLSDLVIDFANVW